MQADKRQALANPFDQKVISPFLARLPHHRLSFAPITDGVARSFVTPCGWDTADAEITPHEAEITPNPHPRINAEMPEL